MRPTTPTLTPHELEIMKIIWERHSATVRDVYEQLRERRKVAYTTVMTLMKVLEQKGHLRREAGDGAAYVYRPSQGKQQAIGGMVKEFIDRVFNGSAKPLLVHLAEQEELTPEDLEELARLIEAGLKPRQREK
jgi:BlaI family transcriptional regulator, penicillinase repressor